MSGVLLIDLCRNKRGRGRGSKTLLLRKRVPCPPPLSILYPPCQKKRLPGGRRMLPNHLQRAPRVLTPVYTHLYLSVCLYTSGDGGGLPTASSSAFSSRASSWSCSRRWVSVGVLLGGGGMKEGGRLAGKSIVSNRTQILVTPRDSPTNGVTR